MHLARAIAVGLLLGPTALASAGDPDLPTRIDVFAITSMRPAITGVREMTHAGITANVHYLDAPMAFEAELSRTLPADPKRAKAIAEAMLKRDGERIARRAAEAWRAPALASIWGIHKLPAVVFNQGRSVVYGETDLAAALARWQTWRSTTNGGQGR